MRRHSVLGLLLAGLCAAQPGGAASSGKCQQALQAQEWVLSQFENPSPEMGEMLEAALQKGKASMVDQVPFFTQQTSWAPYAIQNILASTPWGSADLGEVQYVVSQINAAWQNVTEGQGTIEDTFEPWAEAMSAQATRLAAAARDEANGWDAASRRSALLRAINLYSAGVWPFPAALGVEAALDSIHAAFDDYLKLSPYTAVPFEVEFSNGTATTPLSAVFITPDPSRPLPLVTFILGTDTPKESMFLWYGPAFLERNYSVLFFDGPGQGSTPWKEAHMPFYAQSEDYVTAVLDAALNRSDIAPLVDADRLGLLGYSFGGYLGGRACSMMGDRFSACVLTPPVASMGANYVKQYSDGVYGPFQFILQANASLIPEELQPAFEDPANEIMLPLLTDCDEASGAPELFTAPMQGAGSPVDPEVVYAAVGYAGVTSANVSDLFAAQWAAYRNALSFANDAVNQTTVPMWLAMGTEDNLIGGFERALLDALPEETRQRSRLEVFDAQSGGALHCQSGGLHVFFARLFPWLDPLLQGGSSAQ